MKKYLLPAVLSLLVYACRPSAGDNSGQLRSFPAVQVPSLITGGDDAAEYLALHWWDAFADTSGVLLNDYGHISGVPVGEVEQGMANYAALLSGLPYEQVRKAVNGFCNALETVERHDPADSTFERLTALYERYLYDPNSPLRNEECYLPFCTRMAHSHVLEPVRRGVYEFQASMCSLNRPGTKAADFSFSDRSGRVRTLYSVRAENTLLFFSNPGCEACKEIIDALKAVPGIDAAIGSGRLAILNIYIDEDVATWYEYMPVYPHSWLNGYDHNMLIRSDVLYNVRAIPSLYALDADKNVLMKDALEARILDWVYGICAYARQ